MFVVVVNKVVLSCVTAVAVEIFSNLFIDVVVAACIAVVVDKFLFG